MNQKEYRVYRHTRADNNQVFYIGMTSTENRPYTKHPRSDDWWKVVTKTNYFVDIVADGLTYEEARDLERDLIKEYGRKDLGKGYLTNNHGGGKSYLSAYGRKYSKQHRKHLSENSGQAKRVIDNETGRIYNSATEAANCYGISISHLKNMLNKYRTNKTEMEWV